MNSTQAASSQLKLPGQRSCDEEKNNQKVSSKLIKTHLNLLSSSFALMLFYEENSKTVYFAFEYMLHQTF